MLGCTSRAVSRPRWAAGRGGRKQQAAARASQSNSSARAPQQRQRQRRGHHGENKREPVHAGVGRQAQRHAMSIPALPSASHAKPREPWVASMATQSAATAGTAHQRRIRIPASQREHAHVQRLGQAKEQEQRPAGGVAHAAVNGQHKLDPVADAEPVEHAGGPAQQKAPPRPRLARHGDQQGRESHRRQPGTLDAGNSKVSSAAEASARSQFSTARRRAASSLTASAM